MHYIGTKYGLKCYLKMNQHNNALPALHILHSRAFLFTSQGCCDCSDLLHNGGEVRQGELRVIWVEDVRQRGICGVHHPICDGPDAVPSSEIFYPKRYLLKTPSVEMGPGICQH